MGGFVEVYLDDEDKFKVLLLAFGLFSLAVLCSICLAGSFCPLNRWLHERQSRKRRQQQQSVFGQQPHHVITHSAPPVYLLTAGGKPLAARAPGSSFRRSACDQFYGRGPICAQLSNNSSCSSSFNGPPPAYEAALRASRLQSLTAGTLPFHHQRHQRDQPVEGQPQAESAGADAGAKQQWPPQMVFGEQDRGELDLGDYFHQPKEFSSLEPHIQLPGAACELLTSQQQDGAIDQLGAKAHRQAPVMLRLWVRVMEPGELVRRARGSRDQPDGQLAGGSGGGGGHSARKMSLSRQLSIPQLFGSLVTLASGKQASLASAGAAAAADDHLAPAPTGDQQQQQAEREMHSIVSSGTSSSSDADNNNNTNNSKTMAPQDAGLRPKEEHQRKDDAREREQQSSKGRISKRRDSASNSSSTQPRRRSSSFLSINSITSRVLHMNVASFSYVRDEQLISTKKHNQLNYHHFFTSKPTAKPAAAAQAAPAKSSKLCQLVISICDIENILNSCWQNEKSCALLAYSSAIYVQCEILLPKSKSARLLSYPLRALTSSHHNNQSSQSSSSLGGCGGAGGGGGHSDGEPSTHTVNFSTAISAAALERQPISAPAPPPALCPESAVCSEPTGGCCCHHPAAAAHLQVQPDSQADSLMTDASAETSTIATTDGSASSASFTCDSSVEQPQPAGQNQAAAAGTKAFAFSSAGAAAATTTTNWRHEPSADGKSIVIFNSVPKQIAHEQELAAASFAQQRHETDLIQFDSVFVSPILSKSTIEDGYLRFRVYSQCKYVNESCLAELKLPLKQLLRSETRDNLGDASLNARGAAAMRAPSPMMINQQQADLILDNLLENLVTANTGSPLSTLIEQISTEEREAQELDHQADGCDHHNSDQQQQQQQGGGVFSRLPWLLSLQQQQQQESSDHHQAPSSGKRLKLSSSLNDSLYRLGTQAAASIYQHSRPYAGAAASKEPAAAANSDTQLYLGDFNGGGGVGGHNYDQDGLHWRRSQAEQDEEEAEQEAQRQREQQEAHERLMEQNYCRSLLVSHWLNYLVAPSYECHISDESKGKIILGLTYLPTSNRVIFNAHKATISEEAGGVRQQTMMKNLRLQSSTCYLLRFLMIVNGRVAKRKQTAIARRPEWDSQEPITFDLATVSVAQPNFIVALVMRNATIPAHSSTSSLQKLQQQQQQPAGGQCYYSNGGSSKQRRAPPRGSSSSSSAGRMGAHSEPESARALYSTAPGQHPLSPQQIQQQQQQLQPHYSKRDLVIGHMVIGEEMWRELRSKPRKQIVRQFKIY